MKRTVVILIYLSLHFFSTAWAYYSIISPQQDVDGPPPFDVDVSQILDPTPKSEPFSKLGNPPSYLIQGQRYFVRKTTQGYHERGIASWYGTRFHAERTSSGEPYNMFAMTAANKELPIPCYAKVTNLQNGRQIVVRINDRGPFKPNRIIDLSYVAAKKLGVFPQGTALVEVQAIETNNWRNQVPKVAGRNWWVALKRHPQIYLQIGTFANADNANNLMRKVTRMTNYSARIRPFAMRGSQFYKVQVGPLQSVAESDQLNQQLLDLKLGRPLTVIQ